MKKHFGLLILILIIGCSQFGQQNNSNSQIDKVKKCINSVSYGDIDICLPEIEGMKECYSNSSIKSLADKNEYEQNSVIAFYLNNSTYKRADSLVKLDFDDYFKIYAMKKLKGTRTSQSELKQLTTMFEQNFLEEKLDEVNKMINEKRNYLSVGQMVLIDKYNLNEKVSTLVLLVKLKMNDIEYFVIMTLNLILIKDRLVFLAYYYKYDGESSVIKTKSRNDDIVLHLIEKNK